MTDKNELLTASILLINNKLRFKGTVGDNDPVWSMIKGNVTVETNFKIN